ncbi:MAG TPA: enoyl-CoA hydratase/isomerase family protein [Thermoanaerobaculia bacterium]|nr:enoyl-CoA hydratase/isomerase family protein [Thermoanaerobaculia bacterium]
MARFAVDGDRITFDDGGMNLLSAEALRELRASVEDRQSCLSSAGQAGLPVLHFRSGRPGLFAAGADMAEMQRFTPAEAEEFSRLGQTLFDAIERLPCLTVAEIDGDCFGGALDLALAFDFRFATPRSHFSHPGARIGIATGFGGTSRWRKVTGRSAANTLLLKNAVLSAGEALKIGLVDEVGDDHTASIERLKAVDPLTVRFVKELTIHEASLSRSQLLLLAERLGHLYFGR